MYIDGPAVAWVSCTTGLIVTSGKMAAAGKHIDHTRYLWQGRPAAAGDGGEEREWMEVLEI